MAICERPSPNNTAKFVMPTFRNRQFDAEISMFDDWMRYIHNETGLDWRNMTDRPIIRSMIGDGDFFSTMTTCSSCSNVFDDFYGQNILGSDSYESVFVKAALRFDN